MRHYITIALLLATMASTAAEFYEGGTLHHANLSEWAMGSRRDQIATSADFVVGLGSIEIRRGRDLLTLEDMATKMVACIDYAAQKLDGGLMVTSQIVPCALAYGWNVDQKHLR